MKTFAVLATFLAAAPASAAELRITFAELRAIVQAVMSGAKLHLDTKPGGVFSMGSGSYLEVAGKQTAIPLPAKSFKLLGSNYAYYVDDLNSDGIAVAAVPSGIRLTLSFETKTAALVGACINGDCGLAGALPKIGWRNGTVGIDVVPVQAGTGLALMVSNVSIGGTLSARCDGGGGVFADSACRLALPWANKTIAKLKPEIATTIKAKLNEEKMQAQFAAALKKYLTVGPAGEIGISSVRTDSKQVVISFGLSSGANF